MKIKVKLPAKNETHCLEDIDPEDTVISIKNKISDITKDNVDTMKIIFSGKVLDNNNKISDTQIKDTNTIFCISSKPKPNNTTPTNNQHHNTPNTQPLPNPFLGAFNQPTNNTNTNQ